MVTQQELHVLNVMGGFHEIAGFTNVIGAIDGTHIRIKSPTDDEHLFVNKKIIIQLMFKGYVMRN